MKDKKGRAKGFKRHKDHENQWEHLLRSTQAGRITAIQIESSRRIITKRVKKIGSYKIHVKPLTTVSRKPSEVRMGKGKGAFDHFVARIKAGQILFSVQGIPTNFAELLFKKVQYKLPVKTKMFLQNK